MNAEQKIRKAMHGIMEAGEVNASQVYKSNGIYGCGWYFYKFGRTATFIGSSVSDALDWLKEAADARQEYNY